MSKRLSPKPYCVKIPDTSLARRLILSSASLFICNFILRILLEHLRVALTKHLYDPFVRYASRTDPCRVGGAQVIQPEIRPPSFEGLSPGRPQLPQVSSLVQIAGKEMLSLPRDCQLILECFQSEFRQRDFRYAAWRLGIWNPQDRVEKIDI